jgi:run domain Beclin-1 interacting cysteine-rich containing protein
MKQLASQEYRCTGCGMKQDPAQARYFRFCNYTGKYFCQKCHTNATSVIPAYIMDRWSFKRYYVSNFAHDLLERIHYEPVFDVQNVNPQIYSMVPILAQARDLRTQLVAVKKYLRSCRQAQSLTATFDGYIPWTADIHTYSIDDFQQVKLKLRYLKSLLSDSIKHIKSCPLCQGKGFVCEFCFNPEIIFPFELSKVSVCQYCQCCFHKHCFGNQPCPRCIRIRQRERRRQTNYADED